MKLHLVDDVKQWHRWFTMRLSAGALALATAWTTIPEDWRSAVPKWVLVALFAVYALLIMFGRVVKQKQKPKECEGE